MSPLRAQPYILVSLVLCGIVGISGCAAIKNSSFSYKDMDVAKTSAEAGEGRTVTLQGDPLTLRGKGIRKGDGLRHAKVTAVDLSRVDVAETKGVRIISVVPSLDTPVCEQQTHYLSEKNQGLDQRVELITVSVDTPFAQKRFAREAGIKNVTFYSDYRDVEFGRTYGLLVEQPHFLARTVMVVDRNDVIHHLQVVPELTQLPDMEQAFAVARSLTETAAR